MASLCSPILVRTTRESIRKDAFSASDHTTFLRKRSVGRIFVQSVEGYAPLRRIGPAQVLGGVLPLNLPRQTSVNKDRPDVFFTSDHTPHVRLLKSKRRCYDSSDCPIGSIKIKMLLRRSTPYTNSWLLPLLLCSYTICWYPWITRYAPLVPVFRGQKPQGL